MGKPKFVSQFIPNGLYGKLGCLICPLAGQKCNKHQSIEPHGFAGPGGVYILGLGPGKEEDETGQFFVGPSGRFLKSCFTETQAKSIRYNNVTRTRHLDNSPPQEAVEACRPSVEKDIVVSAPSIIIGLGGYPLAWVLGIPNPSIQAWRGHPFSVRINDFVTWYYPVYHPAYVLRTMWLEDTFRKDITNVYKFLERAET